MNDKSKNTAKIKSKAKRLGFLSCGISKAEFLEEEAPRLENWLNKNMHGEMAYMENHFDKRLDPTILVPDSKSVISLLLNYFPSEAQVENTYKISKYAYGTDYHFIIKDKLKQLMDFISEEIGEVRGRAFVDSAPVLDKAWAAKSGLGWIGKHSNLLTKQLGNTMSVCILERVLHRTLPAMGLGDWEPESPDRWQTGSGRGGSRQSRFRATFKGKHCSVLTIG